MSRLGGHSSAEATALASSRDGHLKLSLSFTNTIGRTSWNIFAPVSPPASRRHSSLIRRKHTSHNERDS